MFFFHIFDFSKFYHVSGKIIKVISEIAAGCCIIRVISPYSGDHIPTKDSLFHLSIVIPLSEQISILYYVFLKLDICQVL